MGSVLKTAYELLTPAEKRRGAGVVTMMLATAAVELLGVGSVLPVLTVAMDPGIVHRHAVLARVYDAFGFESATHFIIFMGVVMIAIIIAMNATSAAALWAQTRFVYGVGHAISTRLMQRYLAQPYAFFLTQHSSRLSRNVLDETFRLVTGVLKPGAALLSRGSVMAAIVGFLLFVEPLITVSLIVIFAGAYTVVYAMIRHRLENRGRRSVEANQARFKATAEAFGGIKEIKSFGREAYFLEQYEGASSRYLRSLAMSQIYTHLPRYLIHTLTFCGFIATFIFLVASRQDLSQVVPVMGFFAFAAVRLLPGFQELLYALAEFRFHAHLLFQIHGELGRKGALEPVPVAGAIAPALPFVRALALDGVRFRYPGADRDAIAGLTLEIPHNSSLALVGMTGAGKTTIVDIILGLLVPGEGTFSVDGTVVTAKTVGAWRRRVGYVPQDSFLADDTVKRNIAYGVGEREIDSAAVEQAARIAHIHDFIVTELPSGYETLVGERGVRLSGGQRQRLGIARALYDDPDVLVLDEATSDIDNITEAYISEAIQALAGRKTLIVVAHRLATIRRCDRIVLIDEGRIVASGSYDDLMATSPAFQRLTRAARVEAAR